MQLKMMTDYAIRILMYMQTKGRVVTRQEISTAMGITDGPLITTLRRLRDAGWLVSSSGSEGGWELATNAETISLLEIMKLTEDTILVNRCLEDGMFCSRSAVDICPVHMVYKRYQEVMEAYFSAITIGDLMKPKK